MVGSRRVKSPSRGRLERRFEKVRGRHKNSLTGWGSLKNHLACIATASSKYRNANREGESLRYRENYMIYFKIFQFYLNTMRVYCIKRGTEDICNYMKFHTPPSELIFARPPPTVEAPIMDTLPPLEFL